ncbi:MATE family efflux transporter [Nocardia fusca]|uniref:Probable multidrug resistance protein NorM n=1 Tax=Nocardia fusca TaxID=941183 RepID=A0ABV3FKH2_9NOCA
MTEGRVPAQEPDERFGVRMWQVARLAGPVVLTSATAVVLGLTDTALLGHHSTEALGIAALVLPLWVFCTALVIPWGSATQISVARWYGAGDTGSIRELVRAGLLGALAIGVMVAFVGAAAAPALVAYTAPAGLDHGEATLMLWILLCGLPFTAATAHLNGVLAGAGDTASGARISVAVAALNAALSAVLIFGAGLGPVGSAVGSTLALIAGSCALVLRVRSVWGFDQVSGVRGPLRNWASLALPDVAFGAASYGADAAIAVIAAGTGAISLAGHRVMSTATSLVWMVVFGTGVAIAVLTGQRLGAGDHHGRVAFIRAGAVVILVCSCALALTVAVVSPWLFQLLSADSEVVQAAAGVVWTLPAVAPVMAVSMIYAAQLRAAGDTKGVMHASLFSVSCVALPAVWVFTTVCHWGLPGIYYGIVAGWIARTAATYLRYAGVSRGRSRNRTAAQVQAGRHHHFDVHNKDVPEQIRD